MSAHVEESWPIPETMVDGITERLRQAIITGAIRPRERIRVADLERKFGVSHIPIREALRRLQSEGFVEVSPRRTTIAAGVDLNDLANIYDLRRIIEIEIGRRSVSRMTKNDVEMVRRALASFQEVANAPSSGEFWERHRNFHWALLYPQLTRQSNGFLIIFGRVRNAMCVCSCLPSRPLTRSCTFTLSFTKRVQEVT